MWLKTMETYSNLKNKYDFWVTFENKMTGEWLNGLILIVIHEPPLNKIIPLIFFSLSGKEHYHALGEEDLQILGINKYILYLC